MNTEQKIAYCAGMFDGEGSIYAVRDYQKNTPQFKVKLQITQKDQPTLDNFRHLVRDFTGGQAWSEFRYRDTENPEAAVRLDYTSSAAYDMAKQMLPYSCVKFNHFEWLIHTWENRMLRSDPKHLDWDFITQRLEARPKKGFDYVGRPLPKNPDVGLYWLAGFFDAEGNVATSRNISFAQKDEAILEHIQTYMSKHWNIKASLVPDNTCTKLTLYGEHMIKLARLIRPIVVLKGPQLDERVLR